LKFNLIDLPNQRKRHEGEIPLIGGICIFLGLCASQFYFNELNQTIIIILISSFLILILGVMDDFFNLGVKFKLIAQLIIIVLTVIFSEIKITSLGNLFGLENTFDLGLLSLPLTIIAIVGLTNAFNMIDGIDGQASFLTIISIMGMFLFNIHIAAPYLFNLLLAILAGLIPFLIFNIISHKNKIFLGDGGSLFLGFNISLALIYSAQNLKIFSPSFALWCVAIPLFDFFCVIILRKINKQSSTIASRDHIHHFLENFYSSKIWILMFVTIAGIGLIALGYFIENNFSSISLPVFILLFFIYLSIRFYFSFKEKHF